MPSKKHRARQKRLQEEHRFASKMETFALKIVNTYERQCETFTELLSLEQSGQFEGCYRRVYDRVAYAHAIQFNLPCDSEQSAYDAAVEVLQPAKLTDVLQIPYDAPVLKNMRAVGVRFHPLFMCALIKPTEESDCSLRHYFAVLLTRKRKLRGNYKLGEFGSDMSVMHPLSAYRDAMLFVNFSRGIASVLPYECFLKNRWFSVDTIFLAEVSDTSGNIIPFSQVKQVYANQ